MAAGVTRLYKKELAEGTHTLTDTYMVALYTSTGINNFNPADDIAYTTVEEVVGQGYTAGGMALSNIRIFSPYDLGQTWDASVLIGFDNPMWDNATITAAGCIVYNASKANRVVVIHSFNQDISSQNQPFTIYFPTMDGTPSTPSYILSM